MKKNLFALVCVVASLMSLTSCLEETGYSYNSTFSRIVTINRDKSPLELVADCSNEKFKLDNLTVPEQLSLFELQDAERAFVTINLQVDNAYKEHWTLVEGKALKVSAIWNQQLPDGASINPLSGLQNYQVETSWSYPTTWIAGNYVNISPIIQSAGRGTYYLQPYTVYGDTLRFDIAAAYTPIKEENYIADFINFDLRTLTDTTAADEHTRGVVRNMLSTIAANDTVCMMIVGDFHDTYYKVDTLADGTVKYEQRDTVRKYPAYTNYANLKALLK
ncbi:MAG: hypothetical protein J6V12_08720 [Bacteroidaceae bacterium]|nr:hypothetical protein [Bacteroidaceae bacterium]